MRTMTPAGQARMKSEGDALLARMQSPDAKLAMQRAFAASPQEMGRAAVAQAQRGR